VSRLEASERAGALEAGVRELQRAVDRLSELSTTIRSYQAAGHEARLTEVLQR
jgi:hypothetical protein